ncbi:MAG TPA: RNA polymerase sigma factor [Polyangiaceae bacterium]|nr:RNA polymerase sigma factor [Polyangiaceae bacterium]
MGALNDLSRCGHYLLASDLSAFDFKHPHRRWLGYDVTDLVLVSTASRDEPACDSEEALVQRLARSEPLALGTVYDLHHAAVRAFAQRLLGDAAAAEDLVHEVFVALPRAIRNFRGDASLRTFVISIAVHHAHHHVRSATRRRVAMAKLEREAAPCVADPEHVARRRELAQALTRALDLLPIEQRVAFVLCEVEERSSPDVARIVGAPEGTVRTRLFHAKKKLRAELVKEGFG